MPIVIPDVDDHTSVAITATRTVQRHDGNGVRPRPVPLYSGGDGTSVEQAVIINASSDEDAVRFEPDWLQQHVHGYRFKAQRLLKVGQKHYLMGSRCECSSTRIGCTRAG